MAVTSVMSLRTILVGSICLWQTVVTTAASCDRTCLPNEGHYMSAKVKMATGRIVNGHDSQNPLPYQVGLQVDVGGKMYKCGGTIISCDYIITAAHCVAGGLTGVKAFAGTRMGPFQDQSSHPEDVQTANALAGPDVVSHPDYNGRTPDGNDIAAIKVDCAFEFTDYIKPAAIPSTDLNQGVPVTISGWGALESGGSSPRVLQVAVVQRVDCDNVTPGGSNEGGKIFCATGKTSGGNTIDGCQGDSGGPAVTNAFNSKYVELVGITSYGKGCARADTWGRYTNVHTYNSWIKQVTGVVPPSTEPTATTTAEPTRIESTTAPIDPTVVPFKWPPRI